MDITINNKPLSTSAATVSQLAAELALPEKGVAVAVDNKLVPRGDWGSSELREGAAVTVIRAAFGG
ncbi:MAG: sulfur carrier protein ThiS [Candidatus Cryptobacteroides sp.]|nr:sulfur carrier protein ThiS [Rikenellaceae bacterium]MDY5746659.1 sulfur carrier protein ThiS [Candidatus Cryptobacteroides sp.]